MLQLVLGRSGSGKSEYVLKKAASCPPDRLLVVVPEQFTLETEKRLLDAFGREALPGGIVTSFSSMAASYTAEYEPSGRYINNFGRRILMARAIGRQNGMLKVYGGKVTDSLVDAFISVISEMKVSCISPEELMEKADCFSGAQVADKLYDIAAVFGEYDRLLSDGCRDSTDDLTKLAEGVRKYGLYKGKTVIFDGFHNYSAQEERVIAAIMEQAGETLITVSCSSVTDMGEEADGSVFENVRADARRILGAAARLGVRVLPPVFLTENVRAHTPQMAGVEKHLIGGGKTFEAAGGVSLYRCGSVADESDLVAALIKKDVRESGCRYSDCAVIARSLVDYEALLPDAFTRAGIPFYMDMREDVTLRPLFTLLLSALKAAAGQRVDENVFACLKTGYFDAGEDEIFELENYVLMWGIKGDDIFCEYGLNPSGYEEMTDRDRELLKGLNRTREKVMPPLQKLCGRLRGEFDGEAMCRALYAFLMELDVPGKVDVESAELRKRGETVRADEAVRLWELAVNVLDQISVAAGGEKLDGKRGLELFRLACEDADMGRIPPVSDGVIIGAADRIRVADVSRVYIIGANEGVFPASASPAGILTDRDREKMKEQGLALGGDAAYWGTEEMFIAYKAFSAASDSITVTYRRTSPGGEALRPSTLVLMLKRLFPSLEETDMEDVSPFVLACCEDAALSVAASRWNDADPRTEKLKDCLRSIPECSERMEAMGSGKTSADAKIESEETARALFGKDMCMSASKLESYHNCRYGFFMKYGLLLKPRRRLRLRADSAGTFVHYVLEHGLRELSGPECPTDKRVEECVDRLGAEYCDRVLSGSVKSAGFMYLIGRLKKLAAAALKNICEEMAQSLFKPDAFELTLAYGGDIPPYEISCKDGKVSIIGKVDRVDTMGAGVGFIRVIDYKTGDKVFSLNDVLYGLNMQMLIYMFAIRSNDGKYGKLQPGGVLYYPVSYDVHAVSAGYDLKKAEKDEVKQMRMNGLLLDDMDCLKGMEEGLNSRYIPVTLDKDGEIKGESVATREQFEAISEYIDILLRDMHDELSHGNIAAVPVKGEGTDACKFCDYYRMCSRDRFSAPERTKTPRKNREAMEEMERLIEERASRRDE